MKSTDRATSTHDHDRRIAGRAQKDGVIDPYRRRAKPSEPTVCPDCGAAFHGGRWQWSEGYRLGQMRTEMPSTPRAGLEMVQKPI